VRDSADGHVIKEYVAAQRQQASVLATNARDMQDMIFIAHSETVTFLSALPPLAGAMFCRPSEPLFIHTLCSRLRIVWRMGWRRRAQARGRTSRLGWHRQARQHVCRASTVARPARTFARVLCSAASCCMEGKLKC
jgi:hypothetical protein